MEYIIVIVLILILILMILGVFFEYKKKSPLVIFYIVLILMSIPFGFYNIFIYSDYSLSVILEANFFILIYISFFIFFRWFFSIAFKNKNVWIDALNSKENVFSNNFLYYFTLISLLCALIGFIYGLKIFSISAMMNLNWWDFVQSSSFLVKICVYFSYMACCSSILSVYFAEGLKRKLILILTILFLLFSIFVLKTRSYLLLMLIPLLLYLFYGNMVAKMKVSLLVLISIFLFILARAVRHATDLNDFLDQDFAILFQGAAEGGEVNLIDGLYYFVSKGNDFEGFNQNITLIRTLFFWLPSFLIDFKPVEVTYYMFQAYYGDHYSYKYSYHPTVFGDAYGNFGLLGSVLYSFYLAFIIGIIEFMSKRNSIIGFYLFALLSVVMLIFARGAFYNAFMYLMVPFFIFYIFNLICKKVSFRLN